MKADIDKNGCLHISPETELESFALNQWVALNSDEKDRDVIVIHPLPVEEVVRT
jgi:hypothetical protein